MLGALAKLETVIVASSLTFENEPKLPVILEANPEDKEFKGAPCIDAPGFEFKAAEPEEDGDPEVFG